MNDLEKISSFCEISETSLTFKKEVSKDQWFSVFQSLKQIEGCVQFWIGDALAYRQQRWGMYEDAVEQTGYAENTLREYKQVAENVKSDIRMSDLDFGHHQVVASLSPEQQKTILKKASEEHLTVKETREEVKALKRGGDKEAAELPKGKYQVILADPPWKYPHDQEYYGQDVEKHYQTLTIDELCELPIKDLADENCVLYLWATSPLLDEIFKVLLAWGFEYKTSMIWDKVKHNMGFYASIRHEILLIAGKGSSKPDDASAANQTDSVYVEEKTEHSKKPDYFYGMIERLHGKKKKRIELFARKKRAGWDSWGNETE